MKQYKQHSKILKVNTLPTSTQILIVFYSKIKKRRS